METRAHYVIVGLFTLLTLLAALGFGVWLVKSGQQQETSRYRILFAETVSGLGVGSLVQYNGLRVGEVKALYLDPQDPRRVFADVEIDSMTPINQGTRAQMVLANITGAANIQLTTDNPDAPALEAADELPPIIRADPSPLGSLLGSGEALISGVDLLVGRGTELLSPQNLDHIAGILANLEQISGDLAQSRGGVETLAGRLERVLEQAEGLLADSRQLVGGANRLLANEVAPALGEGRQALAALARSSARIEQLLQQKSPALAQGADAVAELEPAVRELQRSLVMLNRILSRLENDPAGYLSGKPALQEFSP